MSTAQPSPSGLVTLLTDFGETDGYVGAMKGVMLRVDARVRPVDVAHDVPAQAIRHGGLALRGAAPYFPAGTVHLGVVDPGVGTERDPVVLIAGEHVFVGPDNGLFDAAARALGGIHGARRIERHPWLPEGDAISSTFHGRDVFAPTAAALAAGRLQLDAVGEPIEPVRMDLPEPAPREDGSIEAPVATVDRFGNLITALDERLVRSRRPTVVRLPDGTEVPVRRTYGDVEPGEALALVGSGGLLEVAVRDGSAAERFGLGPDARVVVP